MSERRCPACGNPFRTGSLCFVIVRGLIVRKRVCGPCKRSALRFVATSADYGACRQCSEPARYCEEHRSRATEYDKLERALAFRAAQVRLSIAAHDRNATGLDLEENFTRASLMGKLEGLEMAIAIVRDASQGRPL